MEWFIIPADGGRLNCADGRRASNEDCSGRAFDIWRKSNGWVLTQFTF